MALKCIKASSFFQQPTASTLRSFERSQLLLQAFFSQTPLPPFVRKISLTAQFLAISQVKANEEQPVLLLPLTAAIRFQKISLQPEINSKTPISYGLALINGKQQITRIYLQYPALLELWLLRLSELLNRVGFHDEFRVIGKIGQGSTSTVYKVERLADGRLMAAKVFLNGFLESKSERGESALNEISLLRVMEHRNILKIHSVYESATGLYVLTDLLEGGTLLQRVNAAKGLGLFQVKQVMAGIAEGLSHMHELGVMHRDIKMENIMFRSLDSLEPVIVDLGLAAVSQEEPYLFYRCGTPGYIAPEIITMEGNQKVNVGCDIFSAGVIFHILLTNRFLFEGKNNHEIYRSNKNLSYDLSSKEYERYDVQAMDLLALMLEIDQESRISAEEMLMHEFFSDIGKLSEEQEVSPAITASGEQTFNF